MESYKTIKEKLRAFSIKFYSIKLIKGGILFIALGLLFLLVLGSIEHLLWLDSTGRFILFTVIIAIEVILLYFYIIIPISYLLKLKSGITDKEASVLIGEHFSEIGDRLVNLLDLVEEKDSTELLRASIDQRSHSLGDYPFTKAINYKRAISYVQYLGIPLVIIGALWFTGELTQFIGSYGRVIDYETAYEPPAPFHFRLVSNDFKVLENQTFTLQVYTEGEVVPEEIYIQIDGGQMLLNKKGSIHEYVFIPPYNTTTFYLFSNGIRSSTFTLEVLPVPTIENFVMALDYPDYTNLTDEVITGVGNAVAPEGTKIRWILSGENIENVSIGTNLEKIEFKKESENFEIEKILRDDLYYTVSASNRFAPEYEKLSYRINSIKDEYPELEVRKMADSITESGEYFEVITHDDYLVKRIKLKYYSDTDKDVVHEVLLDAPAVNYKKLRYRFPSGLDLVKGENYSFYFEVTDNDVVNGGKSTRSKTYTNRVLSTQEEKEQNLKNQETLIRDLDKTVENNEVQIETFKKFSDKDRESKDFDYEDKQSIKELLRQQKSQEQRTERISKDLRKNLKDVNAEDNMNKLLQERLRREEMEANKNKELLKQLEEIADKLNKEELAKRIEDIGKKQQNSNRNLKQILELTKRYYVTEKTAQLARELEELSEKQKALSKKETGEQELQEQSDLNRKFDSMEKDLLELQKDNEELSKPVSLDLDKNLQNSIRESQKQAIESLERQNNEGDPGTDNKNKRGSENKSQKSAGEMLQNLSKKLQSPGSSGSDGIVEDAQMLRQILENLLTFSLEQEALYENVKESGSSGNGYAVGVRKQNELGALFEHVDDSLFALSLRRAELSEFVNEQITEVYYNMDRTLESMADNKMYQAASYQQYTVNASNALADFLAKILDNMQMSMQAGKGQGDSDKGFQLPDIIEGQRGIGKQMGQMGQKGEKGNDGQKGNKGQKGQKGENGQDGQDGMGGRNGENGKSGNGKGQGEGEGDDKGRSAGSSQGKEGGQGYGEGAVTEEELRERYEIYKEQEYLKNKLTKQLEDMIQAKDKAIAKKVLRQMEQFQKEVLEQGFTQRTVSRANYIEHELLKLEGAALKQGKKSERESTTSYSNEPNGVLGDYGKSLLNQEDIEILMRQALPLRQFYQKKVRDYFKEDD